MPVGQINVVIGTTAGVTYHAPIGAVQNYDIDIPSGRRVQSVWYHPIDNIADLPKFGHIEVMPSASEDDITLSISALTDCVLRIIISYFYV